MDVQDVDREVRKIRKKLRQIERLQEKPDDLTPEECRKVMVQHALRAQLQELLPLASSTSSSSRRLQVGGQATGRATPDNSYSDLDSSAADLDGSSLLDNSGVAAASQASHTQVGSSAAAQLIDTSLLPMHAATSTTASLNTGTISSVIPTQSTSSTTGQYADRGDDVAAGRDDVTAGSGRVTPPPMVLETSASPTSDPSTTAAAAAATADKSSSRPKAQPSGTSQKQGSKAGASKTAPPPMTEKERQKADFAAFQQSVRSARLAWEACCLDVHHLRDVAGGDDAGMGLTCVDCEGDLLVTGSRDTTVRVWDVASGCVAHSMTGHKDTVTDVALLPEHAPLLEDVEDDCRSHRFVVSSSRDCTLRVWNATQGRQCRSVYTFAPVLCMWWTERAVVTGGDSGRVQIWSWPGLQELCSIRVHEDAITCVQLHGQLLIAGDSLGTIKLWETSRDLRSARPLPSMASVRGSPLRPAEEEDARTAGGCGYRPVQCLCLPNQQCLLWGDDGTNVKIFHLQSGSVRKFPNHLGPYGRTDCFAQSGTAASRASSAAGGSSSIACDLLLSAAYDLDTGEGYVNVRSNSTLQYVTTLRAVAPSRQGFGHIRAMACSHVPASSATGDLATGGRRHRWCVAGDNLTVFDIAPPSKSASASAKSAAKKKNRSEREEDVVDYRCSFFPDLAGIAADSDLESSDDDDDDDGNDVINADGDDDSNRGSEADNEADFSPGKSSTPRRRRHRRGDPSDQSLGVATAQGWWFMRWCNIL